MRFGFRRGIAVAEQVKKAVNGVAINFLYKGHTELTVTLRSGIEVDIDLSFYRPGFVFTQIERKDVCYVIVREVGAVQSKHGGVVGKHHAEAVNRPTFGFEDVVKQLR